MVPSMIFILLSLMSFAIVLVKHGQPRNNDSVWEYLLSAFTAFALLYWGGFFDPLLKAMLVK